MGLLSLNGIGGGGGGGDMAGSDWDSKMASHLFGIALAMLRGGICEFFKGCWKVSPSSSLTNYS